MRRAPAAREYVEKRFQKQRKVLEAPLKTYKRTEHSPSSLFRRELKSGTTIVLLSVLFLVLKLRLWHGKNRDMGYSIMLQAGARISTKINFSLRVSALPLPRSGGAVVLKASRTTSTRTSEAPYCARLILLSGRFLAALRDVRIPSRMQLPVSVDLPTINDSRFGMGLVQYLPSTVVFTPRQTTAGSLLVIHNSGDSEYGL